MENIKKDLMVGETFMHNHFISNKFSSFEIIKVGKKQCKCIDNYNNIVSIDNIILKKLEREKTFSITVQKTKLILDNEIIDCSSSRYALYKIDEEFENIENIEVYNMIKLKKILKDKKACQYLQKIMHNFKKVYKYIDNKIFVQRWYTCDYLHENYTGHKKHEYNFSVDLEAEGITEKYNTIEDIEKIAKKQNKEVIIDLVARKS